MGRMATLFLVGAACILGGDRSGNLIPNASYALDSSGAPQGWKTWTPRNALAVESGVSTSAGGSALSLTARNHASYGSWVTVIPGIQGGRAYAFEAHYLPTNVDREDVSIAAILSWCSGDAGENPIQRDYADRTAAEGQWRRVKESSLPEAVGCRFVVSPCLPFK